MQGLESECKLLLFGCCVDGECGQWNRHHDVLIQTVWARVRRDMITTVPSSSGGSEVLTTSVVRLLRSMVVDDRTGRCCVDRIA